MKLLTLNTHSLAEPDYENKLNLFIEVICREQPDIIAMQEVSQSMEAPVVKTWVLEGFFPCRDCDIPIRQGNHAAEVACRLKEKGISYQWTWMAAKVGYGIYDEGLAMFSKDHAIVDTDICRISTADDYYNWRTRKALGIRTERDNSWYYTAHLGWWDDEAEPFQRQWKRLHRRLTVQGEESCVWILGDFNSPAEIRGQGYDQIRKDGWSDTYALAKEKDSGITVAGIIDGWRDRLDETSAEAEGMRIDHIWCNREVSVASSRALFNGKETPVVSDHYGVMIEIPDIHV